MENRRRICDGLAGSLPASSWRGFVGLGFRAAWRSYKPACNPSAKRNKTSSVLSRGSWHNYLAFPYPGQVMAGGRYLPLPGHEHNACVNAYDVQRHPMKGHQFTLGTQF